MNYQPAVAGNQPNHNVGIKENLDAGKVKKETISAQQYVLLPLWSTGSPTGVRDLRAEFEEFSFNITNRVNTVSTPINAAGPNPTNSTNNFNTASPFDTAVSPNFGIARKSSFIDPSKYPDDLDMPELEDIIYSDDEKDVGAEADLSNLETNISISLIPTTLVHKDHLVTQIISDLTLAPQTRSMERMSMNYQPAVAGNQPNHNVGIKENLDAGKVKKETISAQQYVLLPLWSTGSPTGVRDLRAEFEEFSFNITNRVNTVSTPINAAGPNPTNSTNNFNTASPFDTAVSPNFGIARKSSFIDPSKYPDDLDMPELEDIIYSDDEKDMDVKSDFLYEAIKEEVYVYQPLGFEDLNYPDKVYKVVKALYGLHQAPRACDYAGASLDRKSTTGGCQFLGCRLISWQCKKQTIATSSTEAEYVAAASCCA
uniref:Ribonuclease H-like domain, reverse transcriptase, RNA-dependent DNA polymerase n=1 Tax=Tanacetum cinerariifolium TaxID=118510 RepID=A0A6L2LN42_TANCI|nr:ribonuclease H-like domain, reverse transcriptase, RNA-dependent DNA polymerase [Tanacetum cinerariifolium]